MRATENRDLALVVAADTDVQWLAADLLEEEGFRTVTLAGNSLVCDALAEGRIVLLAVSLEPQEAGAVAAAREVRQAYPGAHVIAICGRPGAAGSRPVRQAAFDAVLEGPFDRLRLQAAVRALG